MSVWRRLSRVGKRAAKFKFVFHVQEVQLEAQKGPWTPKGLSICLTRRNRRYATKPVDWVPTIQNPFSGSIVWAHPEAIEFETTLYRTDSRSGASEFEDKQWHLVIEDAEIAVGSSSSGSKRNVLAAIEINAKDYIAVDGRVNHAAVTLRPVSKKVKSAKVHFTVSCICVKEGRATDEDMMSMASIISMQQRGLNTTVVGSHHHHLMPPHADGTGGMDFGDVGNLRDFDDENSISPAGTLSRRQANKQIAALAEQFGLLVEEANGENSNRKSRASSTLSSSFNAGGNSAVTNTSSFVAAVRKDSLPNSGTSALSDDVNSAVSDRRDNAAVHDLAGTSEVRSVSPNDNDAETRNLRPQSSSLLSTDAFQHSGPTPNFNLVKHAVHAAGAGKAAASTPPPQTLANNVVNNQSEDLLNWAQEATQHYHGVRITNFTTSWRNGMAFCAIVHHFRPDLIAYDSLHANHIEENCRIAFGAAARAGVPRLLDPQDMVSRQQPDKLAIMTYVHQLRMFLDKNNDKRGSVQTAESSNNADNRNNNVNITNDADEHALNNGSAADESSANYERKNSYRYFASTLSPVSESSKASSSSLSLSSPSSSNAASPQHKTTNSGVVVRVLQPSSNISPSKASPLTRTAAAATISLANVGRAATSADFYRPSRNMGEAQHAHNGNMPMDGDDAVATSALQSERHDRARHLVQQQQQNQQNLSPAHAQLSPSSSTLPSKSFSLTTEKMQPSSRVEREDELRVRARQMIQAFKHGRYREMQQQGRRPLLPLNTMLTSSPTVPLMPPAAAASRQHHPASGEAARSSSNSALVSSAASIESPLQRFRATNATVRFRPIAPPTADGFSRMPSIRRSMRFLSRPSTPSMTLQRNATLGPIRRANQLGRHAQSTERLSSTNKTANGERDSSERVSTNDAAQAGNDPDALAANLSAAVEKLNAELMRGVGAEHPAGESDDNVEMFNNSCREAVAANRNDVRPPPVLPVDDATKRMLPSADEPVRFFPDREKRDVADETCVPAPTIDANHAVLRPPNMPVNRQSTEHAVTQDAFRSSSEQPHNNGVSENLPTPQPSPRRRRSSRSSNGHRHDTDDAAAHEETNNNGSAFPKSNKSSNVVAESSPPSSLLSHDGDDSGEQSSIERELRELHNEQQIVDRRARLVEPQLQRIFGATAAAAAAGDGGGAVEDASAGDASSIQPGGKTSTTRDDALLTEWFQLVNKKHELVRREMMLRIREKEVELVKKYDKLKLELEHFSSMSESEKTVAQRKREKMLLDELLEIVAERNELVKQTDVQEQAAERDAIVGQSAIARASEMLANGGGNSSTSGGGASSTLTAALAAKFSAFLAQAEQNGTTTTVTTTTGNGDFNSNKPRSTLPRQTTRSN